MKVEKIPSPVPAYVAVGSLQKGQVYELVRTGFGSNSGDYYLATGTRSGVNLTSGYHSTSMDSDCQFVHCPNAKVVL